MKQLQLEKTTSKEKELFLENANKQIETMTEKLKNKDEEIIFLNMEVKSLKNQAQDVEIWKNKVTEMMESKKKLLEKTEENTMNLIESIKQAQLDQLSSRDKRIEELEELVWLNNVKFTELTNELSQVKGTLGGLRESSIYNNNNNNHHTYTPLSSSLHSRSFNNYYSNSANSHRSSKSFSSPSSIRKKKETVETIKNLLDW